MNSELAFNASGDPFELPSDATGWRVRRLKPRGAPELVYGPDGRPLVLPIEADLDELREAVEQLGRYRLDAVNEDGKLVEGAPAAYVQVVQPRGSEHAAPVSRGETDSVVREAMRLNTELARAVVERFPAMLTASAELLRAADGAGLPARSPRVIEIDDETDDDQREESLAPAPGFDLQALIPQLVPVLMALFGKTGSKLPGLSEMLDWRKAASKTAPKTAKTTPTPNAAQPDGSEKTKATPSAAQPDRSQASSPASPSSSSDTLPPIDPATMAHVIAVQSALTPDEAALAREVASSLAPDELRAWFEALRALSVPDAVEKIRALISKTGGAS